MKRKKQSRGFNKKWISFSKLLGVIFFVKYRGKIIKVKNIILRNEIFAVTLLFFNICIYRLLTILFVSRAGPSGPK